MLPSRLGGRRVERVTELLAEARRVGAVATLRVHLDGRRLGAVDGTR